ncbi:hypothetical protein [Cupriavidus taiwanensis]|uniref:hypothetical protein n=1 Tax=Cupriavidus taiwanensis TaxID=164546 RepID=UPI000E16235F|nr:hypothetical protein [Cupriavidus taiwanensis]SPC13742.1 conserved hypothetical protein [Cupriavidus taiwanensis]
MGRLPLFAPPPDNRCFHAAETGNGTYWLWARPIDVIERREQAMQDKCRWRTRILAVAALAVLLGGCAVGGGADGRESSITTYGTLDIGISHTR